MSKNFRSIKEVQGLQINSMVENFIGIDIYGQPYSLSKALENGNVVLVFIRGQWCPFCNRHIAKIQKELPQIYAKGASIVVISPEKSEYIKRTIEKTGAEFTIIYDEGYKIANAFDVLFLPSKATRLVYNTALGASLKESHSDDSEQLPIPATYIINPDFTVKWRHFDTNYLNRSSVSDIVKNL